ncbi:uncharacterized protein LOC119481999 [Sebastes umbrosus]|uniref:uncharacterized protein LOC119481999 n=1 Tax=Sebastes umbrosus TaxID=72105 RepID=UPI0018A053C3|nr:uncharacterized protein LOC119481999 [Sebastes umbrosus]
MATNSSSTFNFLLYHCFGFRVSRNLNIAFITVRTALSLPLSILVLYLGHQRWQQQRSFKTTSHSDIFTYHLASMDLIWVVGCFCSFYGTYANIMAMISVGFCATTFVFTGEMFFHVLTCVERYLAVVHPVVYLGLKNARGVRIRNISVGCVWLLCFGLTGLIVLKIPDFPINEFSIILIFCLIVVSFCSLSVLCVLIRPGPGDGGGLKEHVDQSKQRAFHTITAILGVLWLWFVGILVSIGLYNSTLLSHSVSCVVILCANWFNLPSSLVLPLLYLHRAGKLSCC